LAATSPHGSAREAPAAAEPGALPRGVLGVFAYSRRALVLVWTTNKTLSIALGCLTLIAGVLPAGVAYVGALIVDAVIHAADLHRHSGSAPLNHVVSLVALEALLVAATAMAQRGISLAQSLLRAQLGQRVNVMILEKALTLDLTQFEDSEFYDKLTRARREASSRPLSLVMRTFGLLQNAASLVSFGGGAARGRRIAGFSGRGKILGRGVQAVPLARAGIAYADLSGVRAGARGPCQGG